MTTESRFFWWWKRETCSTMHHMYHTYIYDRFRHLKSTRFDYLQLVVNCLNENCCDFSFFHLSKSFDSRCYHHNIDIVCLILSSWDFPNHSASCWAHGIFGKLLMSRGALIWFETIWSFDVQVIDYWIIFSMKIK
jgi:hypothetical protein